MEALGQLTGGVAHDFNNIMMIVSGYAQSLQGVLKDPKRARALQAIQAAISRGENLTRQLLSFSRHQPLHPIVLHPSDAVEGIRDVLVGSTNGSIKLSVNIPENTWPASPLPRPCACSARASFQPSHAGRHPHAGGADPRPSSHGRLLTRKITRSR
jgi:signal transduction histidine kinase